VHVGILEPSYFFITRRDRSISSRLQLHCTRGVWRATLIWRFLGTERYECKSSASVEASSSSSSPLVLVLELLALPQSLVCREGRRQQQRTSRPDWAGGNGPCTSVRPVGRQVLFTCTRSIKPMCRWGSGIYFIRLNKISLIFWKWPVQKSFADYNIFPVLGRTKRKNHSIASCVRVWACGTCISRKSTKVVSNGTYSMWKPSCHSR
jgi:hypothetical protein